MNERARDRGGDDFAALLDAFEKQHSGAARAKPQVGDRVSARIVGFGGESAFVDLGGKAEGIIPIAQLTDHEGKRTAEVGDTVDGVVVSFADDIVVLRVRAGGGPAAPAELQQAHTYGLPVEGIVQAVIKGGVEVMVSGIRAFCPISQLDSRYVDDPAGFVGQHLSFRITRYEEGRGRGPNIVLSRRVLLEEEAQERAAKARATLAPGKIVRGTVTSLANYGAFVDLGGIEGLLHVSELGFGRVGHPSELLAVGQEIEVEVKEIGKPDEKGRERISLSRRAFAKDPWQEEASRLVPGARRTGKVARLETFGAFIELAPGVDGLLHLSELSSARGRELRHPRDAVKVGQTLEVVVLSVDVQSRRISLAPAPAIEEGDAADAARARSAEGAGFGAFGDFFAKAKKPKS